MKPSRQFQLTCAFFLGVGFISWFFTQKYIGPFSDTIPMPLANLFAHAGSLTLIILNVAHWYPKK